MPIKLRPARVLRGGSWNNNAQNCRVSNRNRNNPGNRNNNNGFRLSLSSQTSLGLRTGRISRPLK